MKITIAPDSFKGSRTSREAAELIEKGARRVFPGAEYIRIPIADGGEGTVEALVDGLNGTLRSVQCRDPLSRPVDAVYGTIDDKAVIEMAAASGLTLLGKNERDPRITSTYGTGELILAALKAGCRDITIGIGGSATNDGGTGMAAALGFRFLDSGGRPLPPGGAALTKLASIDSSGVHPGLRDARIHVACDVDNPLLGEQGASHIYGPQKGASFETACELDAALARLADTAEAWKGREMRGIPGAGAAGGLGFGLIAFCDAQRKSGIDTVLDLVDFNERISGSSLVITGEGKIDGQSIRGKVPVGVAARCRPAGIPVLALVGSIGTDSRAVYEHGIDSIMNTIESPMTLEEAISRGDVSLTDAAERACRIIRIGMRIQVSPNLPEPGSPS